MTYLLAVFLLFSVPDSAINEIAWVESRNNPTAVSSAGAVGMMQVMPHTARDPGMGVDPLLNPRDPNASKRFARQYFRALLVRTGSVADALRAYNWGLRNVRKWIRMGRPEYMIPHETSVYVQRLEDPVLHALKSSWEQKIIRAEAYASRYVARRDKTGEYNLKRKIDPYRVRIVLLLFQDLKRLGGLPEYRAHILKYGIDLTMPHGIKLTINRDRVMDAPLPGRQSRRPDPNREELNDAVSEATSERVLDEEATEEERQILDEAAVMPRSGSVFVS